MPEPGTAVPATVAAGYARARVLTARAGRTYYLASALLPPAARRGVFALYGFARTADDVVDGPGEPAAKAAALDRLDAGLRAVLAGAAPSAAEPAHRELLAAVGDTVARFGIDPATFEAFLRSMRMDVPGLPEFRARYATLAELREYTYGSAAVIGLQLLPILGMTPRSGPDSYAATAAGAALLGEAFQLTNFLRDVAEDLDRGRIYLPLHELAAFGVDEDRLRADRERGRPSPALRRALAHLVAINRDQYRRTAPAVAALPTRTRPAIAAAARSYGEILVEIERRDYDVLGARAVVPPARRLRHATHAALTAGRA